MRTRVAIADRLLLAAKEVAGRRGSALSRLIDEALRRELARQVFRRPSEVPVFRRGAGPLPGVDLRSNRALLELVDPAPTRRAAPAPPRGAHRRRSGRG